MNQAVITKTTGQDGNLLAEIMLAKAKKVQSGIPRASTFGEQKSNHLELYPDKSQSKKVFASRLAFGRFKATDPTRSAGAMTPPL